MRVIFRVPMAMTRDVTTVPETRHITILQKKAKRERKQIKENLQLAASTVGADANGRKGLHALFAITLTRAFRSRGPIMDFSMIAYISWTTPSPSTLELPKDILSVTPGGLHYSTWQGAPSSLFARILFKIVTTSVAKRRLACGCRGLAPCFPLLRAKCTIKWIMNRPQFFLCFIAILLVSIPFILFYRG